MAHDRDALDTSGFHIRIGEHGVEYARVLRGKSSDSGPEIVPSDADEFAEDLARRSRLLRPVLISEAVIVVATTAVLSLVGHRIQPGMFWWFLPIVCGISARVLNSGRVARRLLIPIDYVFTSGSRTSSRSIDDLLSTLRGVDRVWVERFPRRPSLPILEPAWIDVPATTPFDANIQVEGLVIRLGDDSAELHFPPDSIIFRKGGSYHVCPYARLDARASAIETLREFDLPADVTVLETTWLHERKDGSPDLRYKDNPRLHRIVFGLIELATPDGERLAIGVSSPAAATRVVDLLKRLRDARRQEARSCVDLEWARARPPFPEPPRLIGEFIVDAVEFATRNLMFDWILGLPDWLALVVTGVVTAIPIAFLVAIAATGKQLLWLPFAASGLLAIPSIGRLFVGLRQTAERDEIGASPRFRSESARRIEEEDFSAASDREPIRESRAGAIAAEVLARPLDRVIADGVLSDDERRPFDEPARSLDVDDSRKERKARPRSAAATVPPEPLPPAAGSRTESPVAPAKAIPELLPLESTPTTQPPDVSPLAWNFEELVAPPSTASPARPKPFELKARPDEVQPLLFAAPTSAREPRVHPVTTTRPEPIPPRPRPIAPARPEPIVPPTQRSEPLAPPVWHGRGASVRVGSYTLIDPLTYVCDRDTLFDEASCIDRRLSVGVPTFEPAGALGYYPTYARLTPSQRAGYLAWMASGRTGPLHDIGYAFLFFYGLERRLLIENQDLSPIVKEVNRLLDTYRISSSFDRYLGRFLAYVVARAGIATLKEKWFRAVLEETKVPRDPDVLAVGLAWLAENRRPLPANWALRIGRMDPRCPRGIVLDRLPSEFEALFKRRYEDRFGEGMTLKFAREIEIAYHPASPSLLGIDSGRVELKPVRIPHVMGIQSQFQPIVDIWRDAVEELKPLGRVARSAGVVRTREAYEAMPAELRSGVEHPDKAAWDKLASDLMREDGTVLVPVSRLLEIRGFSSTTKPTIKQCRALATTAEQLGFLIEPDARITGRPHDPNDRVALLRGEPGAPETVADSKYLAASLMLELGMFIAAADGSIEEGEVNQIAGFLESQFRLDATETRRLDALKHLFIDNPPTLSGIGRFVERTMTPDQRIAVGRFLVGVAASDGTLHDREIDALKRVYRTLKIEIADLNGMLGDLREPSTATEPDEPPAPPSAPARVVATDSPPVPSNTGFTLDPARLRSIMGETERVARLLGEAMNELDPESESEVPLPSGQEPPEPVSIPPVEPLPPPLAAAAAPASDLDGLDARHRAFVVTLIDRESLTRAEFNRLAREHSLLPSGAMDLLNEWAEIRFGDLLLDDDGENLVVVRHIAARIRI